LSAILTPEPAVEIIRVPYKPRKWALAALHQHFKRWTVIVIHRRGGKTTAVLNHHQRAATNDRWEAARLKAVNPRFTDAHVDELLKGRNYAHILPTLKQAKATSWELLKSISRDARLAKNETELSVTYPNGNVVRLWGADNIDALRGIKLSGVSYDEYADHPPNVHGTVISKALADHVGYGIFAGTIKGKNQLYKTWKAAKDNPDWSALWQDIDVSLATEEGATVEALRVALEDERQQVRMGLMLQEEFDQEWFLSPEAAIRGAIFGKQMTAARNEGRLTRVPYDPLLPVETDWDLGIADNMVIWFSQRLRTGETRFIDFYTNRGEGIPHYINVLRDRGYVYGKHHAPHDIRVRELSNGKSRWETAKALGIEFEIVPQHSLEDGINAARLLLPRSWFDTDKCDYGIEALTQYRWGWNDTLNQPTKEPVHDWSSHPADGFRGRASREETALVKDDGAWDDFGYGGKHTIGSDDTGWMG
jgi:phage terminase large subunit